MLLNKVGIFLAFCCFLVSAKKSFVSEISEDDKSIRESVPRDSLTNNINSVVKHKFSEIKKTKNSKVLPKKSKKKLPQHTNYQNVPSSSDGLNGLEGKNWVKNPHSWAGRFNRTRGDNSINQQFNGESYWAKKFNRTREYYGREDHTENDKNGNFANSFNRTRGHNWNKNPHRGNGWAGKFNRTREHNWKNQGFNRESHWASRFNRTRGENWWNRFNEGTLKEIIENKADLFLNGPLIKKAN